LIQVHSSASCRAFAAEGRASLEIADRAADRRWYAVFTVPQNEKAVAKHLALREVESFLPTYETERIWKNRQRVHLVLPLFPSYLFVRISNRERGRVLRSPGVLRLVGTSKGPIPVPDSIIEFLRSDLCNGKVEPYHELVVGNRVRIKAGAMQGLEGVLIRKNDNLRFVLTIEMINQHAAVQIGSENLEPVID
jgi:transcription antitermination factor NusG